MKHKKKKNKKPLELLLLELPMACKAPMFPMACIVPRASQLFGGGRARPREEQVFVHASVLQFVLFLFWTFFF